ncbi:MAG: DEAD/DEAH box helicase, partial [Dehalococcoidia bacterium]|nr:DEAD/DEAH box helicase [Dehalococcoidia bacterium]
MAPATGTFGALTLSAPVARALRDMGYVAPTPIQANAIPPLLAGQDVVGRAKTGTGKTASFGIPIAELIDPADCVVQALVLTPTRELARQVADDIANIGKYRNLRVLAVYGGESIGKQLAALEQGVHVVVGTPGRIIDHLSRGSLSLSHVKFVVLDECDEMLDIGFADDIETILRRTPRKRQTALFSATIPLFVRKLVWRYMKDPVTVEIATDEPTAERVRQYYYEVAEREKTALLIELLNSMTGDERVLIFRRTQMGVDHLTKALWNDGFHIQALHGGLRQKERNEVMQAFRSGKLPLLVATNVAARGIDVNGITHVV